MQGRLTAAVNDSSTCFPDSPNLTVLKRARLSPPPPPSMLPPSATKWEGSRVSSALGQDSRLWTRLSSRAPIGPPVRLALAVDFSPPASRLVLLAMGLDGYRAAAAAAAWFALSIPAKWSAKRAEMRQPGTGAQPGTPSPLPFMSALKSSVSDASRRWRPSRTVSW